MLNTDTTCTKVNLCLIHSRKSTRVTLKKHNEKFLSNFSLREPCEKRIRSNLNPLVSSRLKELFPALGQVCDCQLFCPAKGVDLKSRAAIQKLY